MAFYEAGQLCIRCGAYRHVARSALAHDAERIGTWCGTHRRIVRSVLVRDGSLACLCEQSVKSLSTTLLRFIDSGL